MAAIRIAADINRLPQRARCLGKHGKSLAIKNGVRRQRMGNMEQDHFTDTYGLIAPVGQP